MGYRSKIDHFIQKRIYRKRRYERFSRGPPGVNFRVQGARAYALRTRIAADVHSPCRVPVPTAPRRVADTKQAKEDIPQYRVSPGGRRVHEFHDGKVP